MVMQAQDTATVTIPATPPDEPLASTATPVTTAPVKPRNVKGRVTAWLRTVNGMPVLVVQATGTGKRSLRYSVEGTNLPGSLVLPPVVITKKKRRVEIPIVVFGNVIISRKGAKPLTQIVDQPTYFVGDWTFSEPADAISEPEEAELMLHCTSSPYTGEEQKTLFATIKQHGIYPNNLDIGMLIWGSNVEYKAGWEVKIPIQFKRLVKGVDMRLQIEGLPPIPVLFPTLPKPHISIAGPAWVKKGDNWFLRLTVTNNRLKIEDTIFAINEDKVGIVLKDEVISIALGLQREFDIPFEELRHTSGDGHLNVLIYPHFKGQLPIPQFVGDAPTTPEPSPTAADVPTPIVDAASSVEATAAAPVSTPAPAPQEAPVLTGTILDYIGTPASGDATTEPAPEPQVEVPAAQAAALVTDITVSEPVPTPTTAAPKTQRPALILRADYEKVWKMVAFALGENSTGILVKNISEVDQKLRLWIEMDGGKLTPVNPLEQTVGPSKMILVEFPFLLSPDSSYQLWNLTSIVAFVSGPTQDFLGKAEIQEGVLWIFMRWYGEKMDHETDLFTVQPNIKEPKIIRTAVKLPNDDGGDQQAIICKEMQPGELVVIYYNDKPVFATNFKLPPA